MNLAKMTNKNLIVLDVSVATKEEATSFIKKILLVQKKNSLIL